MNDPIQKFWNNRWLLSIVAGLLLGLSFPPFPFPFLQFPAIILFFRIIECSHSAREAAYFAYPGFLVWNIIATYWLMMASLPAGIAAILANAVLMSLILMIQFKAQQKLINGWLIALVQTAFWISFEYLHHHWDLSWPWLSLGNGWANATQVVQYISATGFLGISFWVMFSCALFYQSIRNTYKRYRVAAVSVAVLFPLISLLQLPFVSTKSNTDTTVETVVAQPNFDSYEELGGFSTTRQTLNLLFRLSDSVRTSRTKLILWPENGIHPYLSNRISTNVAARNTKSRLKNKADDWNTTIVGGAGFINYFSPGHLPSLPQWTGDTAYLTYNAAVGFYPGHRMQVYRKHNLVTIVERFPFVKFFNAVDVFGLIDWADIQGYGQGNKVDQFKVGSTKTPALICYDSVYPGWIRNFVRNGAGFLTVITNDGWWGNSSGHIQHFDYARLRAIEFRRWVVRSANNGISGVIAPDGSVKKQTTFWTRTAFRYEVPVITKQTIYTRFGDWLPVGLLFISIGGLGLIIAKRYTHLERL